MVYHWPARGGAGAGDWGFQGCLVGCCGVQGGGQTVRSCAVTPGACGGAQARKPLAPLPLP